MEHGYRLRRAALSRGAPWDLAGAMLTEAGVLVTFCARSRPRVLRWYAANAPTLARLLQPVTSVSAVLRSSPRSRLWQGHPGAGTTRGGRARGGDRGELLRLFRASEREFCGRHHRARRGAGGAGTLERLAQRPHRAQPRRPAASLLALHANMLDQVRTSRRGQKSAREKFFSRLRVPALRGSPVGEVIRARRARRPTCP